MSQATINPTRQAGFTMIEVLVAMLIIVLGLLGLAGLQVRMQQAEFESYQRAQALVLLYDIVDRVNVNRETASCFAITAATGSPYFGKDSAPPACGASAIAAINAMADAAMAEWDGSLKGAAEIKGGVSVGAIVDARGCVNYDAASELTNPATGAVLPGTGVFTVSVAWQGTVDTFAPAVNCANTLYGAETRRRVVSTTFRMANLP